jgi:tetratricopeptide (TPR) repeat protein
MIGASPALNVIRDQDIAKEIQQALKDATKASEDIPDPHEQAQVLARIAMVQAKSGAMGAAKTTFEKAATAARTLPVNDRKQADDRFQLLFLIVHCWARSDDWAGAQAFFDDIVANDPLRNFGPIPEHYRHEFQGIVAIRQLEAGQLEKALKAADDLDRSWRDYFNKRRAELRAEAKDWPKALQIAEKIDDAGMRGSALAGISVLQHKAGRKEEAQGNVEKARKLLEGNNPGDGRFRLALATAYVSLEQAGEGLRLVESIQNGNTYRWEREEALARIYLEMGDLPNSLKWARGVRDLVPGMEYPFRQIAAARAKSKQFKEAFETIDEMKEPTFRAHALMDIGEEQHRAGLNAAAAETFRLVVHTAEKAPPPERSSALFNHAGLFGQIAQAQAELGEAAAARVWIDRQIATNNRAFALAGLAEGLHKRLQAAKK